MEAGTFQAVSDRFPHIEQARHNETLAIDLVNSGYRFKDWSITAAFYAAIHYFEARLHDDPRYTHREASNRIDHSEDSVPITTGHRNYSPHAWRERLLRSNCDPQTWRAYRTLRVASETARYHAGNAISSTAHNYFTDQDVDQHVITHLGQVKLGLGVS